MSRLEQLAVAVESCEEEKNCKNSPTYQGSFSKCSECKWSLCNGVTVFGTRDLWRPLRKSLRHSRREVFRRWEAKEKRTRRRYQGQQLRAKQDRSRQKRLRQAKAAEKRTEQQIIKATKNSGRVRGDGDHLSQNRIALDTKQQSARLNPVVVLAELDKIRQDARRNGLAAGGLVIENQHQRLVVVFDLEDYPRVIGNHS